jgi:broad specificity phosphatase PhoE
MRLYLIRHAQSAANVGATDHPDSLLSEAGRRDATRLAEAFRGVALTCILSSPFRRALETAEAIRRATGAPAELYPPMHEHRHEPFGAEWPLATREQLAEAFPAFAQPAEMPAQRWAAVPEDDPQQWRRVTRVIRDLAARFGESDPPDAPNVALVSHHAPMADFVRAFCQWTNPLGVELTFDNASVTVLDFARPRRLVRLNCPPEALG